MQKLHKHETTRQPQSEISAFELGKQNAPPKPSFEVIDLQRRADRLELLVCQILRKLHFN